MKENKSVRDESVSGRKTAIISDLHNNLTNLQKVLDYCAKNEIKTLICCGDLASLETLDFLNDNFSGNIYFVFGNMDDDQLKNHDFGEKYKKTFIFKESGEATLNDKQIAFVHFPWMAEKLARSGRYDFIFYGHTHKPWRSGASAKDAMGQERECIMLNPGNAAGEIYPPTFAVWSADGDEFELIRIYGLKG